jgi:hypothetical protein
MMLIDYVVKRVKELSTQAMEPNSGSERLESTNVILAKL